MKHISKTIFLLLAMIFLVSAVAGCGGSKNKTKEPSSSKQDPKPVSRIGEETLQYPGENEEYKYNVYETYIDIREYVGSETAVTVPGTIEDLPVKVVGGFSFAKQIKSITLPEGIVIIRSYAFDHCDNLETINIPESVVEIGSYAFDDSNALKTLTIPKGVKKIGINAFGGSYKSRETLTVRFYKGTAGAEFVAGKEIKFEIIDE